jgi:G:T-mismatch repair DNA endonuclease (very short patch repair protein)
MESNPNWRGGLSHQKCTSCGKDLSPNNRSGLCRKCAFTGEKNPFYGKKHTPQTHEKMSSSQQKRDPNTRHVIEWSSDERSKNAKKRWDRMSEPERKKRMIPFIEAGLKANKKSSQTKIEVVVGSVLDSLHVQHQNNVQIGAYNVDLLLGNKIIVECFGDFWHCNPKVYGPEYQNKSLHCAASDKWEKDKKRIEHLESLGYRVLVLWEYDIKRSINTVEEELLDAINRG